MTPTITEIKCGVPSLRLVSQYDPPSGRPGLRGWTVEGVSALYENGYDETTRRDDSEK